MSRSHLTWDEKNPKSTIMMKNKGRSLNFFQLAQAPYSKPNGIKRPTVARSRLTARPSECSVVATAIAMDRRVLDGRTVAEGSHELQLIASRFRPDASGSSHVKSSNQA